MGSVRVLINAYACSPNMGSEPGMAWNWCVNLAKHCELHIITEGEFRDEIERVVPTLPQGKNMHFYYNPVSEDVRKMCWNQGDWRFYWHYEKWQKSTLEIAKRVCADNKIDILHQLNMIGFREPGYLWKIVDKPFVWGPVDAKDSFPVAYLHNAGLKSKIITNAKNTITKLQLLASSRVRKAVERSSFVISASSESKRSFKRYFNVDSPLLNETGCYVSQRDISVEKSIGDSFNTLWVGKLDLRKQLYLAIRAIARSKVKDVKLHIVGAGDDKAYKRLAQQEGVEDQCIWYGLLPFGKVQEMMRTSDLFLFTSVAEGTPHVVLESIGNNLPVLCFDVCGHGDSVDESVGVKIRLSNPDQSIVDFSEQIKYLYNHRDVLAEMSHNCKERSEVLSWDNKARQMVALYNQTLSI
ncbi:MAG: glycosyltransferase [Rikenellaceae bacterium]